jgi:hypothetical protein
MIMDCTSSLFVSAPTRGVKKYWGGVLSNSANLNTSDAKKGVTKTSQNRHFLYVAFSLQKKSFDW